MESTTKYKAAVSELKKVLKALPEKHEVCVEIAGARDEVLERYQPIFNSEYVGGITEGEFRSFLNIKNNRHWALQKRSGEMCADMPRLRETLSLLLNESEPIAERLEQATKIVIGMGTATAILLVAYPGKYGVWNDTSESGLKWIGLWPEFERSDSFGDKYVKINELLLSLSKDIQTDLWTLDTLWWGLETPESEKDVELPQSEEQSFFLEKHLHDFLFDNWEKTDLGSEWEIYGEEGDDTAGYEYPTDIGNIDILARHRNEPRWLVVELKRDQTSDTTIGQILRYMGYVKKHLAGPDDKVEGLIIAHEVNEKTRYALSAIQSVSIMLYQVDFHLIRPTDLDI